MKDCSEADLMATSVAFRLRSTQLWTTLLVRRQAQAQRRICLDRPCTDFGIFGLEPKKEHRQAEADPVLQKSTPGLTYAQTNVDEAMGQLHMAQGHQQISIVIQGWVTSAQIQNGRQRCQDALLRCSVGVHGGGGLVRVVHVGRDALHNLIACSSMRHIENIQHQTYAQPRSQRLSTPPGQ